MAINNDVFETLRASVLNREVTVSISVFRPSANGVQTYDMFHYR